MCTLIVASRMWEALPLLLAANRDERLDRPALPPARDDAGPIPVLAPRDLQAGGTWLGLNACGLFVGITNRFGAGRDPSKRSRGLVVRTALAHPDPAAAASAVCALDAPGFSPFHLFLASRDQLVRLWSDGVRFAREALGPGWHLLTERSLGAGETAREPFLLHRLAALGLDGPPAESELQALLATHTEAPFDSPCVHLPALSYGTRSSTIVGLGRAVDAVRFLHADGPPCQVPFADCSSLARDLLTAGALARARPG